MKKIFSTLACGLLLFAACSKDDEQIQTPENQSGNLTFEISAGASSGMTKVAVYGQEPVLHVTNVKVYAFKSNGTDFLYTKTYNVTGWTDGMTFKRYDVADADTLPAGTYKFLAVGRNASDLYTLTTLTGTTKFDDVQTSVTANGNENDIYSGTAQVTIQASQGSRVSIDMKRKVAGIMGYFKNVPSEINGTAVRYLRLSITNVNQAVNLITGAGIPTATTPFNIINLDLQGQTISGGVYTGNDLSGQGVVKLPNTQLSGMYLIPVNGITMTLGLYDAGGNALKTWNIKNSGNTSFAVTANNFYALGQKIKPGYTDNNTPDPNDDDNPIDLLSNQEISITIIPAWEMINNLTIE